MIDMDMRAENEVDLLRCDARQRQLREKRIVVAVVPMREIRAHLIVADATIDKDRVATGLHEIGLDRHDDLPGHR